MGMRNIERLLERQSSPNGGGGGLNIGVSDGLIGFYETTPVVQPSGASQAAVTSVTDSTGGTADGTLADVTATYSQSTLNNNFADLAAKVNANVTLLNQIRSDLVTLGLIKGSA